MKNITIKLSAIIIALLVLIFILVNNFDQNTKEKVVDNKFIEGVELDERNKHSPIIESADDINLYPQQQSMDERSKKNFYDLLESLPKDQKEYYLYANNKLFNSLQFKNEKEKLLLQQNGFPTTEEVVLAFEDNPSLTSLQVANERASGNASGSKPNTFLSDEINPGALAALLLVRNVSEIERVIHLYMPEFPLGEGLPMSKDWPSSKYPTLYTEAIDNLIRSLVGIDKESGIGKLALLRYEQLNFYKRPKEEMAEMTVKELNNVYLSMPVESIKSHAQEKYPEAFDKYWVE